MTKIKKAFKPGFRKFFFAVGIEVALFITLFIKPELASVCLDAMWKIGGVYLGAQSAQNLGSIIFNKDNGEW